MKIIIFLNKYRLYVISKFIEFLYENRKLIFILAISSLLSVVFVVFRALYSGQLYFLFLIWNLFLAWLPMLFASIVIHYGTEAKKHKLLIAISFLAWLAFFPNSAYMITDFLHLKSRPGIPHWYDLLLIFTFAWNGLLLALLSLHLIRVFLADKKGERASWIIVSLLITLCGFGIYLGRYLRWNSWDIVSNPHILALDIADRFINPLAHSRTYGMTILFGAFIFVAYITLNYLMSPDFKAIISKTRNN